MRRLAVSVIAAVVVATALVVYGRHERSHAVRVEQARMLDVLDAVRGRLLAQHATISNPPLQFTCAFYGLDELCFDPRHRLVETVDRHNRIGTVRWDHTAAPWVMPDALWHKVFTTTPAVSYYP